MRRTALVTGATGFVGGHLAERLAAAGWTVRALARATSDTRALERLGAEVVRGGLDEVDALAAAAAGADTVFHLAAATTAASEEAFHRVNAAGTAAVVAGLLRAGPRPRRLVYLSSYAACGPARGGRARRVDEPPAPLTAYGRTKLAGEAAAHAAEAHGVEVAVVRAPAVYGPGDRAFLPLFRLAKRALAPAPTGPPRRVHLIFVEDLARAVLRAADAPPGTYAVAEPVEHLAAEVPREIGRALGRRVHRLPVPAAAFRAAGAVAERVGPLLGAKGVFSREKAEEILAEAWVCDLAGSGELLAPHEATPLAEGMRRTAAWYRDQGWI